LSPPEGGPDEVFALAAGDWIRVPTPEAAGPIRAWSSPAGVSVGWADAGRLSAAPVSVDADSVSLGPVSPAGRIPEGAVLWSVGRVLYAAVRDAQSLRVSLAADPSATPIVAAEVREQAGVTPVLADGPRVIAMWWERLGRDGRPAPLPALHTLELSLATGATLHSGPQPASKFISAEEFRTLALLLFVVVLGVLVIVLRGDLDEDAVPLPPGYALAQTSRRFVATGIDFAVAAAVVAELWGVAFWDLLSLRLLFVDTADWMAIPAAFVTGGLIGTVGEWASGRTVGKLLTGIRVVRAIPTAEGSRRIGLRRALIRNATKWLLPPVTVLAAVDGNGRHRGDQIAGVAVVVERRPEGD
jgi:uncharacterized RDD family membrane protein YckC